MEAHVMGGWTPGEVLRAATLGSAEAIDREADLGSIETGKVADLVILDRSPLSDIRNRLSIAMVMQRGQLYDGNTLEELGPLKRPFGHPWYWDDRQPGTSNSGGLLIESGKVQ